MESARPNILITGTPGTGKSSLCMEISDRCGLRHINVGEWIKERNLHTGRDEEFDSYLYDEDKVVDELEELMTQGGNIIDFHSCDFFPQRWFDLVIVLKVNNTVLYDRLMARNYSMKKVQENIECEIMQVLVEEASDSYDAEIVQILCNDTIEDMNRNADRIQEWVQLYLKQ